MTAGPDAAAPLVLELSPSPATSSPAASVLGKPDEDAWNRHVRERLAIRRHAAALERQAEEDATIAAFKATPGYLVTEGHRRELVERDGEEATAAYVDMLAYRAALEALDVAGQRRRRLRAEELAGLKVTSATGEALISTARQSAKSCQPRNVLTKCGCGARLLDAGCGRVDCVRCVPHTTKRRSRPVVAKLEGGIDAERERLRRQSGRSWPRSRFAVQVAVLTMPLECRELLASKVAHNRFRRNIVQVFRRNLGAAFAMVATHPVGDVDPTVFHPHFNVLWMRRGLVPWMLPEATLAELKRCWSYLLEHDGHLPPQSRAWRKAARTDKRLPFRFPAGPSRWPVDVHGSWVKGDDAKRLRHRARYYARAFAGWSFWLPKAVQWFGDYPRGLVPVVVCPCCGQGFSLLGMGADAAAKMEELERLARQRGQAPPAPAGAQRSLPLEPPSRGPAPFVAPSGAPCAGV